MVDRNGYATTYEYDANGNRTAVHYANGYTTTYEYDLLNRLIRQETIDKDSNVVVQYIYTLGAAGERLSVTEPDRTVEYTYDSLYRLTSETITEGDKTTSYTYAYDSVSNRTLKTENGTETAYVYNELNQLVSDSDCSYEYYLNGNLVRVIGSDRSALYEYNSENKLVKATVQNGSLVTEETYTYDYAGNRTSKTTRTSDGSVEYTKYLNDTNSSLTNVLVELDENGTVKYAYTLGADLISQDREGKTSFYLYDGHGSVTALANENGTVTDTYVYDAFGNLLKSTGSTANNYLYCGEQFDSTTGLYYLRARYMDTSTGRFISQDSYAGSIDDPTSLHKYLYANANPANNIDPNGYSAEVNLDLYKNIWLELDEAAEHINKLIGSINNEVEYDKNVLRVGKELLFHLRNSGMEIAINSLLEPYVGPEIASLIASGVIKVFNVVEDFKEAEISEVLENVLNKREKDMIGDYKDINGHHILMKKSFDNDVSYDPKYGFCISDKFMKRMGWNHSKITGKQHSMCADLFKNKDRSNNIFAQIDIAYQSLIEGGATPADAAFVIAVALVDLIAKGTINPTTIPWYAGRTR